MMKLMTTKRVAAGVAVTGLVGIVAAVAQVWPLVAVVVIVLQALGVVMLFVVRNDSARMRNDSAHTRSSVLRVEQRLDAAGARSTVIDEQIRADIADRLSELTELTQHWHKATDQEERVSDAPPSSTG